MSPEALARLVDGRQQFLAFVQKRIQSKDAAEDILQDAFARTVERGGAVRDEESVVAWFYRVLRNAIIDHYRRQGREETLSELPDRAEGPTLNDVCQCVTTLLQNVKPEYREALEIVEVEDGSLSDLAGKAGITPNNAAVRVHRAREALRKQVLAACGVCATHGCINCQCEKC